MISPSGSKYVLAMTCRSSTLAWRSLAPPRAVNDSFQISTRPGGSVFRKERYWTTEVDPSARRFDTGKATRLARGHHEHSHHYRTVVRLRKLLAASRLWFLAGG